MRFRFSLLAIFTLALVLNGCADKTLRTYEANVPIYQSLEEWRQTDFTVEAPRDMRRPGKIYIYGQYLLVNEFLTGVHIFDNTSPSNPINLGFLPVLANVDMAVRNNILYLDSYTDLLAIDISDPRNPRLQNRVEDMFEFYAYGALDDYDFNYPSATVYNEKGVVIGWKVEKVTEETQNYNPWYYNDFASLDVASTGGIQTGVSANPSTVGTGGSTARFTIWENFLYTLQSFKLDAFDLSGDPVRTASINLNNNCETLFPHEGRLFIGTTTGMLIYDLSNGANPTFISEFRHFEACDPVVVQGNRAYVTLRTGTNCRNDVNRLEIIDISDIQNPELMHEHNMTNPHGLGVDGDLLFICDGADGLKIFDKTDPQTIPQNRISHFPGIVTNDVIPYNGTLIMTSESGIYQYDYSNPGNVYQLSHLPIVR